MSIQILRPPLVCRVFVDNANMAYMHCTSGVRPYSSQQSQRWFSLGYRHRLHALCATGSHGSVFCGFPQSFSRCAFSMVRSIREVDKCMKEAQPPFWSRFPLSVFFKYKSLHSTELSNFNTGYDFLLCCNSIQCEKIGVGLIIKGDTFAHSSLSLALSPTLSQDTLSSTGSLHGTALGRPKKPRNETLAAVCP